MLATATCVRNFPLPSYSGKEFPGKETIATRTLYVPNESDKFLHVHRALHGFMEILLTFARSFAGAVSLREREGETEREIFSFF